MVDGEQSDLNNVVGEGEEIDREVEACIVCEILEREREKYRNNFKGLREMAMKKKKEKQQRWGMTSRGPLGKWRS